MPARKTLYLLRRPLIDSPESLLPSTSMPTPGQSVSLVLLEGALSLTPSFPGPVYVLCSPSDGVREPDGKQRIAYPELVALIAEHDVTIVL